VGAEGNALPSPAPALPVPDEAFLEKARGLRPFYFVVVVWGERYTDFLLNFCFASLLSPGNIPSLANRGDGTHNKFLIATTDEDWARMQDRPIFRRMREFVEPVFVRIPPSPEGVSGYVHMGIGHKLTTHMAFEARAYSVLLTPDLMLSDGTMAAVQRHAVDGVQVVLTAALRFGEEPLFENLERLGIASIDSRFGDEARPLVASGRQFVWAGIRSFHSETARYEWDAPWFSVFPVACWWRVPQEDGILVHSLSWAPLLVDYDAVEHHDSSMMDHWTIDGDYVYRNFGTEGRVYVVQDSDEMMLVSWAPLADREQSLEPHRWYGHPRWGRLARGLTLCETFHGRVFDPLKRRIFFKPVYWHSRDVVHGWREIEATAQATLRLFVSPGVLHGIFGTRRLVGMVVKVAPIVIRPMRLAHYYWTGRSRVLGIAIRALRGDSAARERIGNHLKFVQRMLLG